MAAACTGSTSMSELLCPTTLRCATVNVLQTPWRYHFQAKARCHGARQKCASEPAVQLTTVMCCREFAEGAAVGLRSKDLERDRSQGVKVY